MPPVAICLLTDFGTRDPYVGSMKGVIASRCDAAIIDLTHEITPFDVFEAAWFLRTVWRWWPEGTVFVCVVDPGVGTARRILAAESESRFFLAPDNGLLSLTALEKVVSVDDESLFLPGGSTTFHGRDRFAPVAAALAGGRALRRLGAEAGAVERLDYAPPEYEPRSARGTIVAIDRFGNCITDLEIARIAPRMRTILCGGHTVRSWRTSYLAGGEEPFAIVGSTGMIELSVANGSAAAALQLRRGERVEVIAE